MAFPNTAILGAAITFVMIASSSVQAFSHVKPFPRTNNNNNNVITRRAFMDPSIHDAMHSVSSVVSTMYTATLPPLDPDTTNAISTMKDYFIPTTSNDATLKTLEGYVQAKQAFSGGAGGTSLPNSSDLIRYDTVMPGAKGLANPSIQAQMAMQKNTYHDKIDKNELEWIAQQFDIYMRKIPFAVTVYALLDFFVLSPANSPDLLSEELEEDRGAVVKDWVSGAISKIGVLASIVLAIIFIENLTYHPV